MQHAKRTSEGRDERLRLVTEYFGGAFDTVRREVSRRHAADDDILDAFAALWTAERILKGVAITIPDVPPEDRLGLRMEMVT